MDSGSDSDEDPGCFTFPLSKSEEHELKEAFKKYTTMDDKMVDFHMLDIELRMNCSGESQLIRNSEIKGETPRERITAREHLVKRIQGIISPSLHNNFVRETFSSPGHSDFFVYTWHCRGLSKSFRFFPKISKGHATGSHSRVTWFLSSKKLVDDVDDYDPDEAKKTWQKQA
jgi:hypothetical protein